MHGDEGEIDNLEKIIESPKLIDIRERAFAFAVRIVKLCKFLEKNSDVSKNLINQLLNAGALQISTRNLLRGLPLAKLSFCE